MLSQRTGENPASGTRSHTQVSSTFPMTCASEPAMHSPIVNYNMEFVTSTGHSVDGATADVTADQYHKYKVSL